jgi:hypothetical protein
MTKESAGYILKLADNFGTQSERWTPEEHVLFGRSEMAKLEALLGNQTGAKIQMAREMVDKVEAANPGFKKFLDDTGLGSHAGLILEVIHHCDRLSKRSK